MTKILFKFKNDHIVYFEIKGHTNFDFYGNDIVCASISSTTTMTLNGLLEIMKLDDIEYIIDEGHIYCNLERVASSKTDILTKSLYSILKDISIQYPKNVKLKMEEL